MEVSIFYFKLFKFNVFIFQLPQQMAMEMFSTIAQMQPRVMERVLPNDPMVLHSIIKLHLQQLAVLVIYSTFKYFNLSYYLFQYLLLEMVQVRAEEQSLQLLRLNNQQKLFLRKQLLLLYFLQKNDLVPLQIQTYRSRLVWRSHQVLQHLDGKFLYKLRRSKNIANTKDPQS